MAHPITLILLLSFFNPQFSFFSHQHRFRNVYTKSLNSLNYPIPIMNEECWDSRIPQWLQDRLVVLGFPTPSQVQAESADILFNGKSAVIQAETGSGKTLAYLLPMLSLIDPTKTKVQAIVIVPTRELGLQVKSVASQLASGLPGNNRIEIMGLLEGSRNRRQRAWAWSSPPHIIISNPQTLETMIQKGGLCIYKGVKYVVVDEVDACCDQHSQLGQSLHNILSKFLCPTYEKVYMERGKKVNIDTSEFVVKRSVQQIVFLSASIPQKDRFLKMCKQKHWILSSNPIFLQITNDANGFNHFLRTPVQIKHYVIYCQEKIQKLALLRKYIKSIFMQIELGIIFMNKDRPMAEIAQILNLDIKNIGLSLHDNDEEEGHDNDEEKEEGHETDDELYNNTNDNHKNKKQLKKKSISNLKSFKKNKKKQKKEGKSDCIVGFINDAHHINDKDKIMTSFRAGVHKLIIATDGVASRGLDIPDISHIIHFDIPKSDDVYLHRSGRTGRMGRRGIVTTIASIADQFLVARISNSLAIPIDEIDE